MKLKISETADPNYLGSVVTIPEIKDHPNAERLSFVEIFGNSIIIGKGLYNTGDLVCYFPVECCIDPKFLSWANLFDNPDLNADGKTKSYFKKDFRVKAISLRSMPSQGFLFKVSEMAKYYNTPESDFKLGESFDTVGDDRLITKYIRPDSKCRGDSNVKKSKIPEWVNTIVGYLPKPIRRVVYRPIKWLYMGSVDDGIKSQIVDGQWRQHYHTENLGKNIFVLSPDDDITISSKFHGTNFCAGNVLCKRKLTLFEKLIKRHIINVAEVEYKFIYSSRNIIKSRRDGKYTEDVYGIIASEIENKIPPGFEIFGEIVGWSSNNRNVQKNYDYGVTRGECELRVFRVIRVDESGNIIELSWDEIETFCKDNDLKTVHVYYKGKAEDLFHDIKVDEDFGAAFLTRLHKKYLDKNCEFCTSDIVNEGVVVKINSKDSKPVFKFKSPAFVLGESKSRDNNEENIDEDN